MGDRFSDLTGVLGDAFTISPGKATIDSSAIAAPYTLKLPAAPGAVGESLAISAIAGDEISLGFSSQQSATGAIQPFFMATSLSFTAIPANGWRASPTYQGSEPGAWIVISLIRLRIRSRYDQEMELRLIDTWFNGEENLATPVQTWMLHEFAEGIYDFCPDFESASRRSAVTDFKFVLEDRGDNTSGTGMIEVWGVTNVPEIYV